MIEWIRNIRQSAFETLHGVSFTCWFFESERNVKTGIRTSPVLSGEIMADPCVTNSANAYRRDWVNRRKTTLNKLTALADMRHSRMLYDNIKETIAKLKQSAEGELQDLHPRRDRQARARQMVRTRSWRESLPTPWNPPPPPSPSSTPPSALAPRPRHRRRSLQPPSRPRAPWWTPWSRPRCALTPPPTIQSNGRGSWHLLPQVWLQPLDQARRQGQRLLWLHWALPRDQGTTPQRLRHGEINPTHRPPNQRQSHRDLRRHLPRQHYPLYPVPGILGDETGYGEMRDRGNVRRTTGSPRRVGRHPPHDIRRAHDVLHADLRPGQGHAHRVKVHQDPYDAGNEARHGHLAN